MDHLDSTTLISLSAVLLLLNSSYILSLRVLSKSTPTSLRILFIWHAFDFLIHSIFEGSFLYNCFFTSSPYDPAIHHPALITNFLGQPDRLYGAAYGDNWATKLWMIYAKADSRWGGADLTVVSLELLTVLGAGPLALWICTMIAKRDPMASFWMVVLATGELYGGLFLSFLSSSSFYLMLIVCVRVGFMTFAPEWLTGNQNLDGSNFMFLWVYLVFFNMLWVFLPIYAMYVSFEDMKNAFQMRKSMIIARAQMQKEKEDKSK
jgi:hypothetical protein